MTYRDDPGIPRTFITMPLEMSTVLGHFDTVFEEIFSLYKSDEPLWQLLAEHTHRLLQHNLPADPNDMRGYLQELLDVYVGSQDNHPTFVRDIAWFNEYLEPSLRILKITLERNNHIVRSVTASAVAFNPYTEMATLIFECVPINTVGPETPNPHDIFQARELDRYHPCETTPPIHLYEETYQPEHDINIFAVPD